MLIRKLIVWMAERVTEFLAGAGLALMVLGPSNFPLGASYWEEFRTSLFGVGFFYVASGYIVSAVAVGLFSRRPRPLGHGAAMAALFIAHTLIFFLFLGAGNSFPFLLIAGGAIAVFLINAAGAAVLKGRSTSPAE